MSGEFGNYSEMQENCIFRDQIDIPDSHSRLGVHLKSGFNFFCYKIPAISGRMPVLPD